MRLLASINTHIGSTATDSMRISIGQRASSFIPAPIGPPRRQPQQCSSSKSASPPPSDSTTEGRGQEEPKPKSKPKHHGKYHHQHTPDRRTQLLSLSKAVVLGSLGLSAVPDPAASLSSLLMTPAAANAAEGEGLMPGLVVNKGAAMSTGMAARMIQEQCQPILEAYKADPLQRFLYRGEDIHRPTLLACPPDLLDPVTYREAGAADFFGRVEEAMATAPDSAKTFTVRPSTGHLATSDVRCAAAWGTPCSIWPLGPLHYAWFPSIKEWWPMPEKMRAPTGDVATLRRFLLKEAKVDRDLQLALSRGHEVLLKCELPAAGGSAGGVTYGFLAVPIAYERELRARLGLKYD